MKTTIHQYSPTWAAIRYALTHRIACCQEVLDKFGPDEYWSTEMALAESARALLLESTIMTLES